MTGVVATLWAEMITVALVDDHDLVRSGVRSMLADRSDIEVVGEADCGEDAVDLLRQQPVDVVLLDLDMPGIGGLEATRKLLRIRPDVKIVIVTAYIEDPLPRRLLDAGASGYLTKHCGLDEMVLAIHRVCDNKRYLCADVAQQLALANTGDSSDQPLDNLSQRELQVLMMVGKGLKNKEISDQLCLSPKTISTYRHRLYYKLGAHSDVDLAQLALRYGLVDAVDI